MIVSTMVGGGVQWVRRGDGMPCPYILFFHFLFGNNFELIEKLQEYKDLLERLHRDSLLTFFHICFIFIFSLYMYAFLLSLFESK